MMRKSTLIFWKPRSSSSRGSALSYMPSVILESSTRTEVWTAASGRCCRKSRKSDDTENLANGGFWTTPPLRCPVVPVRKSVVVFLRRDEVPHVAAHKTHQQL